MWHQKSKEKRERQKKRQDKERAVCLGTHSLFRLGFHNSLGFRDHRLRFFVSFSFSSLSSPAAFYYAKRRRTTNDDDDDIIIDRFETDASHIIISSPLLGRQISFEKKKKKKKKEYEHTNALVALRLSLSLSFFLRSVGRGRL